VGLLNFTDDDGVRWRVWHVETPAARAHLMDPSYRSGWLVFEREDGGERRRLSGVPDDWISLTPHQLELLCESAVPVINGRSTPTGQQAVWARPDEGERSER
jgi:hypothetical protein